MSTIHWMSGSSLICWRATFALEIPSIQHDSLVSATFRHSSISSMYPNISNTPPVLSCIQIAFDRTAWHAQHSTQGEITKLLLLQSISVQAKSNLRDLGQISYTYILDQEHTSLEAIFIYTIIIILKLNVSYLIKGRFLLLRGHYICTVLKVTQVEQPLISYLDQLRRYKAVFLSDICVSKPQVFIFCQVSDLDNADMTRQKMT